MTRKSTAAKAAPEADSSPSTTPPAFNAPLQMIGVDEIHESPTNPRKHDDGAKFAELVASVASKGVLTPVLVRPSPRAMEENLSSPAFELVYGHRRFRAAKEAGLGIIPANVRELTDREVLEIQIVENAQRADIHPLDEADAFKRLHKEHGLTVDQVAEKTGKSKAYVYARMKLCALVDEKAREWFLSGELSAETALLIARMDAKDQGKAAKHVLERGLSTRAAERELLNQGFLLRVANAPFDASDASLVAAAGACTKCPKRVDPQGLVVIGQKVTSTDICDDGDCWSSKEDAHREKKFAPAIAQGMKPLSKRENAKLFNDWGGMRLHGTGYVRPEDQIPWEVTGSYSSRTTWKEALVRIQKAGGNVQPIAALDDKGNLLTLALQKDVIAAAKKAKVALKKQPKKPSQPMKRTPPPGKMTEEQRTELKNKEAIEHLATQTCANASKLVFANLAQAVAGNAKAEAKVMALLVDRILDEAQWALDEAKLLKPFGFSNTTRGPARLRAIEKLKPDQLRTLAVYAWLANVNEADMGPTLDEILDLEGPNAGFPDCVHDLGKALGIDFVALEKKALTDYKAALEALKNPPKKDVQAPAAKAAGKKSPFKKIADETRKRIAAKPKAKK